MPAGQFASVYPCCPHCAAARPRYMGGYMGERYMGGYTRINIIYTYLCTQCRSRFRLNRRPPLRLVFKLVWYATLMETHLRRVRSTDARRVALHALRALPVELRERVVREARLW